MSNIDWSKAPEGAEFYALGSFFKRSDHRTMHYANNAEEWLQSGYSVAAIKALEDYQPRPQQWPETDERIDNIGRNRTEDDMGHYNAPERTTIDELRQPVSAADFLSEGLKTLSERAKQYDPNGKKELSFNQVAEAFNAVTGKAITGTDVCLMLVMLKIVRQNATEGFHLDSAVDGVNYMALWAELLNSSD